MASGASPRSLTSHRWTASTATRPPPLRLVARGCWSTSQRHLIPSAVPSGVDSALPLTMVFCLPPLLHPGKIRRPCLAGVNCFTLHSSSTLGVSTCGPHHPLSSVRQESPSGVHHSLHRPPSSSGRHPGVDRRHLHPFPSVSSGPSTVLDTASCIASSSSSQVRSSIRKRTALGGCLLPLPTSHGSEVIQPACVALPST